MKCPKCEKGNAVLVTTEASRTGRDRKGIILWILLFPFMLIYTLFRIAFGRKQKYYKKTYYHCNYCGYDFPQSFEKKEEKSEK